MVIENSFQEITIILLVAAFVGAVGARLKQPLIVSFIAVGILVGPSGFNVISSHQEIELLAHIGIAILLFIVGLKLDLTLIRTMGTVALATGLGQVIFTSFFGFLIALGFGMSLVGAAYTALALTFSSTIIIVKLLSDKKEIDSLHGRIAVGFLIVQDILVVLSMIGLSSFSGPGGQDSSLVLEILKALGKGALFSGLILLMMKTIIPRLMDQLARSQELLLLFSISWAVFLGAVGDILGLSTEVGAFLAGISLASTPYREAIGSRLVTLRDFLLLFFFIDLGSRLEISMLGDQALSSLVFSVFVLIGNPLIVMIIMGVMGYRKRTSFLAGLAVAQISEFSLILASLGLSLGHLDKETVGLITLVGIITIGISTYMILYSSNLYQFLSPWLSVFERKEAGKESSQDNTHSFERVDVILMGLGQYGSSIARRLLERGKSVVAVDFDPEVLKCWRQRGLNVLYGDATDPEILEHLPLNRAKWVVSTIPSLETNISLLKALRNNNFKAKIVVSCRKPEDVTLLENHGADMVLRPFVDAAEQAVDSLSEAMLEVSEKIHWQSDIGEVRLPPGSVLIGKRLDQIPLRSDHSVSVLAISRAGKSIFDPRPEFVLFPGDRLVLIGEPENVAEASRVMRKQDADFSDDVTDEFVVGSVEVSKECSWANRSIESLNFRKKFGATIIGIQRKNTRIMSPQPIEMIMPGDILILAGARGNLDKLTSIETGRQRGQNHEI